MRVRSVSALFAAAVLAGALTGASATAQTGAAPASQATGPSAPNPTAESVTEQQLLQQNRKIRGRITIPDPKEAILEQPQGRTYRAFHEWVLPWLAAVVIVGTTVALAAFYLVHGPIRLQSRPSGKKIKRFTFVERFTHWLTATSFIVLAITGLNYFLGKRLLPPLMGYDAFATWSQLAKFAHNAFALPFILGLVLMAALWIRNNIPDEYDLNWLKRLGGFLSGERIPARKFNAGEKLVFWSIVVGGIALTASGIVLLFPFSVADIDGIHVAQYVHAIAGTLMIALIIAHIYIGTIGMQGAFEAMYSGEVDLAWAKEHHSVWVAEEQVRTPDGPRLGKDVVPAE
jgi:formate dehydrogenase subunit gamma